MKKNDLISFVGEELIINFTSSDYNANIYVSYGIYSSEHIFLWTCGDLMHMEILSTVESGKVEVEMNIADVLNEKR